MKKLVYLIVAIVALGLIVAGCISTVPPTEQDELGSLTKASSTICVDDDGTPGVDCDYNTIQEAIDAATTVDGDIIYVKAGTYNIGSNYAYPGFTIDKEITLQGVNRDNTIIDGQLSSQTIKITASNVTITGFTFCNSRMFDIVTDTKNIQNNLILTGNIFEGRIHPYSINDLEVSLNQISGIAVWRSSGMVANNTMNNILMGICLYFCDDSITVCDNTINAREGENTDDGIYIQSSSNIIVEGNTITGFTAGERQYYNNGTDGAGISILSSTNCTVNDNELANNTLGVLVEKAGEGSGIHINNNNFEGNTEFGVLNCGVWTGKDKTYTPASVTIDATCNWWSDIGGPGNGFDDDGISGNAVSDNVDFSPWLLSLAPDAMCYSWESFDKIVECAVSATNHGKFVSCVTHLTNDWLKNGDITAEDKDAIMSWAAKSDIGKE